MGRAAEKPMMAGITPKQIEESKERARELLRLAYAPQPVKQKDGSVLHLCWNGRMQRAMDMAYKLSQQEENPTLKKTLARLEQAIDVLDKQARAAADAAEQASSDYNALCAAAGVEAEDLRPPECDCEGCRLSKANNQYWSALGSMRSAFYRLFMATDVDEKERPAIIDLVEATGAKQEGARKELWQRICAIAKAQKDYAEACEQLGWEPRWKEVFSWR